MAEPLLEVRDLSVAYKTGKSSMTVLAGLHLSVGSEIVGIHGASGCGKTTFARAALRLLPQSRAVITGQIRLKDAGDLNVLAPHELSSIRGRRLALIPQEPSVALNPVRTVGQQVAAVFHAHAHGVQDADTVEHWFRRLFGAEGARIAASYPHELSGGQRQRVVFIQAACCSPSVIIADEPTASLDSVARKETLMLFKEFHQAHGTAVVLISHDAEALAFLCRRLVELRDGRLT